MVIELLGERDGVTLRPDDGEGEVESDGEGESEADGETDGQSVGAVATTRMAYASATYKTPLAPTAMEDG